MRRLLFAMLLMSPLSPAATTVEAPAADDAARARRGVADGRYVALQGLIDDAIRRHPGRLLEVDLDDDEYEIEILRDDGVIVELEYDARSGRLLDTEVEEHD
jgi:uncharacterized membrane protein YkoI